MNKITVDGGRVPILSWADDVEQSALDQAFDLVRHLPIHSHLALMPDAHMGNGMPVGGVMPLVGAIAPNAVGVDIGCGMLAVKTNLTSIDINVHKEIRNKLWDTIPVGFKKHGTPREWEGFDWTPDIKMVRAELDNARKSLGTLGGGNHFIEFQQDEEEFIWYMIHSGSRNLGYKICNHYNGIASKVGNWDIQDMPYFTENQSEFTEYRVAMAFALDFALANRRRMSREIQRAFRLVLGEDEVNFGININIHHNYATWESHDGEGVFVHRKGATSAVEGQLGIIPGSQGSASYIVRGKGSPDSFNSCSHGAGRVMSRTKATGLNYRGKRKHPAAITVEDATAAMGELECRFTEQNVDEAPQAYKDIEQVMREQEDLVDIVHRLVPYQIAAMKG